MAHQRVKSGGGGEKLPRNLRRITSDLNFGKELNSLGETPLEMRFTRSVGWVNIETEILSNTRDAIVILLISIDRGRE